MRLLLIEPKSCQCVVCGKKATLVKEISFVHPAMGAALPQLDVDVPICGCLYRGNKIWNNICTCLYLVFVILFFVSLAIDNKTLRGVAVFSILGLYLFNKLIFLLTKQGKTISMQALQQYPPTAILLSNGWHVKGSPAPMRPAPLDRNFINDYANLLASRYGYNVAP